MLRLLRLVLPALVPSWRFFDEIAPSPRIDVLNGEDWQDVNPPSPKPVPATILFRLVWNPERNAALFLTSCAERVLQDHCAHAEREIIGRARARHPVARAVRIQTIGREGDRFVREVHWTATLDP